MPHTLYNCDKTVPILAIRWPYIELNAFLEPSKLFQAALDIHRMFYLLLQRENSGSLDVRGFAGHHTIRHCCPLLQYEGYLMVSCYSEGSLDAEIFMVHAFKWWPVLLEVICPNCPIVIHIHKTNDILHLFSLEYIQV